MNFLNFHQLPAKIRQGFLESSSPIHRDNLVIGTEEPRHRHLEPFIYRTPV